MDPKAYIDSVERQGRAIYKETSRYRVTVPKGKAGPWEVDQYETKLDLYYLRLARDGRSPGLGTFTRLVHERRGTVMSDTCAEVEDLLRYIHNLRGNVLITGLGLGMAIHILTKVKPFKEAVERITVIEKDAHVLDLVAPHYLKTKKVSIVHADAFEWQPSSGARFDSAWHDIWDVIGEEAREEYGKLRRRYSKFIRRGQQFCWGQHSR